jgi:hypothetical protein
VSRQWNGLPGRSKLVLGIARDPPFPITHLVANMSLWYRIVWMPSRHRARIPESYSLMWTRCTSHFDMLQTYIWNKHISDCLSAFQEVKHAPNFRAKLDVVWFLVHCMTVRSTVLLVVIPQTIRVMSPLDTHEIWDLQGFSSLTWEETWTFDWYREANTFHMAWHRCLQVTLDQTVSRGIAVDGHLEASGDG